MGGGGFLAVYSQGLWGQWAPVQLHKGPLSQAPTLTWTAREVLVSAVWETLTSSLLRQEGPKPGKWRRVALSPQNPNFRVHPHSL
jgi:hypothetical protein